MGACASKKSFAAKNEEYFDTQLESLQLEIKAAREKLQESNKKRAKIETELVSVLETNHYFRTTLGKMQCEQVDNLKNLSGSIRRTAIDAGYFHLQYKTMVPKLNERKRINEQLMDKYRSLERQQRMYQLHVESN